MSKSLPEISKPTFPPSTSSPIIKHAAVCIVFVALTAAADDVIVDGVRLNGDNEDEETGLAALSDGRDRWRVSWVRRPNIEREICREEGEEDEVLTGW